MTSTEHNRIDRVEGQDKLFYTSAARLGTITRAGVAGGTMTFGASVVITVIPEPRTVGKYPEGKNAQLLNDPRLVDRIGEGRRVTTIYGALAPAAGIEYTDSFTASLSLIPSVSDTADFVDAPTETLKLTPSFVENAQFVDSFTETLTLSPSATDTAQFADSFTELFKLAPSTSDIALFADAPVGVVVLTPSLSELATFVDSFTETLKLTSTVSDTAQFVDSFTLDRLKFTPTMDEVYVPGAMTDSFTETFTLSPSISELAAFVDSITESFKLTPSTSDVVVYVDSFAEALSLKPSVSEFATFTDTTQGKVTFTPSIADVYLPPGGVDSFTVPLSLTFSLVFEEYFPFYVCPTIELFQAYTGDLSNKFSAIVSDHWSMTLADPKLSVVISNKNTGNVLKRWTAILRKC